ncbi:MAG: hypothetical protein ACQEXJ_00680 [Myxococcota bacterium]
MSDLPDWDAFYERLLEVYWPSVPPDLRHETRPDAQEGDPEVPSDIWRSVLLIFPDPEAWLHNPIPNLRRRTPLQVLRDGEPDALRAILMEVSTFMLPPPEEVRPWPGEE